MHRYLRSPQSNANLTTRFNRSVLPKHQENPYVVLHRELSLKSPEFTSAKKYKMVSPTKKLNLRNIFKRRLDFSQTTRRQLHSPRSKNNSVSGERQDSVASTDRISRAAESRGLRNLESTKRGSSRQTAKTSGNRSEVQSVRLLNFSKESEKATPLKLRIRKIKKINNRSTANTTKLKFFIQRKEQKTPLKREEKKPLNSTLSMVGLEEVYRQSSPSSHLRKHRGSGQSAISRTFIAEERDFKGNWKNLDIRVQEQNVTRRAEWLTPQQNEEYRRQQYKLLLLRERELEKAYKRNQLILSDCITAERDYATYESYVGDQFQLDELMSQMEDFICDLVKPLAGPIDELADQSMIRDMHVEDTLTNHASNILSCFSRFQPTQSGMTSQEIFWKSMALTAAASSDQVRRIQTEISAQFACVQIFESREHLRVSCSHCLLNPILQIPLPFRSLSNSKLISLLELEVSRGQSGVRVCFKEEENRQIKKLSAIFYLKNTIEGCLIDSKIICKARSLIPRFAQDIEQVKVDIQIGNTHCKALKSDAYSVNVEMREIRSFGLTERGFKKFLEDSISFESLVS